MKAPYKKIAGNFLLFTGCIPLVFALFFLAKQQVIRHKMKEKLEQQVLHTLKLAACDVYWLNNKEIRVNGKMFDVKSFSVENGQYNFTGLFDEEETALVKQLEKNTRQHNESGNRLLVQILQWFQSVYPDIITTLLRTGESVKLRYYFISPDLFSPFKTILTPPPRV